MKAHPESPLELLGVGCELCGSRAARELYTAKDRLRNSDQLFSIVVCGGCGAIRTLPEMTEAELARFYPKDYWGNDGEPTEDWIKSSQSEKIRFLASCGLLQGRILDVGCGSGFFLRALDPVKWDRFGVETGGAAAVAANRAIGNGRVFVGTLIQSECEDEAFDVVTLWSALEHMNEPRANLLEARRIIRPGGTLIVQVPNAASYQARLFGGNWFALDAPRHRYHFTPQILEQSLAQSGFKLYRTTFFSKAHNSHALRQSLKSILYRRDSSMLRRAMFLAAIPFIKPADFLMSAIGKGATLTVAARAT